MHLKLVMIHKFAKLKSSHSMFLLVVLYLPTMITMKRRLRNSIHLLASLILAFCSPNVSSSTLPPSMQQLVKGVQVPQLILISGCTGTGKSTFGMEVAINHGILKCISTDTIRQVMRTCYRENNVASEALLRSSYQGEDDPVKNWFEACGAIEAGIEGIVDDCINRGVSLVLEGVHVVPGPKLLERWSSKGGLAIGTVLTIPDANVHEKVIKRRGEITGKGSGQQSGKIDRIRCIHDEMVRLGKEHQWLLIEQKPRLEPKPIDMVTDLIQNRYMEGNFDRAE